MGFSDNVFVNCPFDEEYLPLLRPLLFTIIYLGLKPRIALEELDSGAPRIQKIIRLITASRYAIHDLSRLQAREAGEYYRLNMPFELGIDVGCRLFGKDPWAQKRCLVLETQQYRYQTAISDMSNSDIAVHNGDPRAVVTEVRNWLNDQAGLQAPGPSSIWGAFLDFMADNYETLKQRGFSDRDIEKLPINELMQCIERWAKKHTEKPSNRRRKIRR
jgi:hypothetical protein